MGFRTKMLDGKVAWVEAGNGEKLVGVLVHMDTVPVNAAEWETPTHELTLKDGFLLGRGTADNKGPAILSMFALRAAMQAGELDDKRVRIIFGGDEEQPEWRCMQRYRETEEIPSLSFSPDGRYPVTYSEKGILHMEIFGESGDSSLELSAGGVWNVVSDYAAAGFEGKKYEARGKAAHAASPALGENAILKLAEKLADEGCGHPFVKLLEMADVNGFDIALSDDMSGEVTINPAIAKCSGGSELLCCDLRLPVTVEPAEVLRRISERVASLGFSVRETSLTPALYVPKDSELVVKLQSVYREITGRDEDAVSSGGSTYAKAFPNAVAFGAGFAGEHSNIHQANENWNLENARITFQIITNAMRIL